MSVWDTHWNNIDPNQNTLLLYHNSALILLQQDGESRFSTTADQQHRALWVVYTVSWTLQWSRQNSKHRSTTCNQKIETVEDPRGKQMVIYCIIQYQAYQHDQLNDVQKLKQPSTRKFQLFQQLISHTIQRMRDKCSLKKDHCIREVHKSAPDKSSASWSNLSSTSVFPKSNRYTSRKWRLD